MLLQRDTQICKVNIRSITGISCWACKTDGLTVSKYIVLHSNVVKESYTELAYHCFWHSS